MAPALVLPPPVLVFVPVAKAAFDVVARTRNPAAISVATIVKNFVVLTIS